MSRGIIAIEDRVGVTFFLSALVPKFETSKRSRYGVGVVGMIYAKLTTFLRFVFLTVTAFEFKTCNIRLEGL